MAEGQHSFLHCEAWRCGRSSGKQPRTSRYFVARDATAHTPSPAWLEVDREAFRARVIQQPKREELVQIQLNEQLIVELYSK